MRIVLATRNRDKLRELSGILHPNGWTLLSLEDFPGSESVAEDGKTFLENAFKKARAAFAATGVPSLADDSGLEVDCLGGKPGVFSSRFAGDGATYDENNEKLLLLMRGVARERRTARFRCVMAFTDGGVEHWTEGTVEGVILDSCRGADGFGYDPVFFIPEAGMTFAEMDEASKNRISHRGTAMRRMADFLVKHYEEDEAERY